MKSDPHWQDLLTQAADGHHMVQLYQDDDSLTETVVRFVLAGIAKGDGIMMIATRAHCDLFCLALEERGIDVQKATANKQLRLLDAEETLTHFMRNGKPDWGAFEALIGGVIDDTRKRYPNLRAYGEMVNVLWHEGQRDAAAQLEEYWNILGQRKPF